MLICNLYLTLVVMISLGRNWLFSIGCFLKSHKVWGSHDGLTHTHIHTTVYTLLFTFVQYTIYITAILHNQKSILHYSVRSNKVASIILYTVWGQPAWASTWKQSTNDKMVDCIIITGHISHSYYIPSSAMSAGISFWQRSEPESGIVLGTNGNPMYVFSLHITVTWAFTTKNNN